MYATIITVICNLILAPLFIYVFDWGIRGAALATMLSQMVTLMWQIKLLSNPNELMHLRKGIYALRARFVKGILGIGLSPFLINAAACIVVIIINKGLRKYVDNGDLAIASYGIANRVIFTFIMVVLGVTQGMQPIVGYNFGARHYDRVKETLKQTIIWALAVTFNGFALCEGIPELISRAFTTDTTLIVNAAKGMRISCLFIMLAGVQMVATNFFQSIGRVNKAIFLSLTRQVLFLIPLLLILPQYMGENGVWCSIPIADLISGTLAIFLLKGQFKSWSKPTFMAGSQQ
jgi:Na+-driven multidrug efflux pump